MFFRVVIKTLELLVHLFLIVGVPVIYLDITTGYNKYRLPEQMPVVYVYWLVYIVIIAIIYGISQKTKKYQRPDCTKNSSDT
ncbi:MAG: hypothetical protein VW882_02430 [Gammaproteobacteria bacterium]